MTDSVHPYIHLRKQIRQAGKQFRQVHDNSASLFHPDGGFVYAYDMAAVENALNEYEVSLPSEYLAVKAAETMETQLLIDAKALSESHASMEVRDFAREVMAFLVLHLGQKLPEAPPEAVPSFLSLVSPVQPERDVINE